MLWIYNLGRGHMRLLKAYELYNINTRVVDFIKITTHFSLKLFLYFKMFL